MTAIPGMTAISDDREPKNVTLEERIITEKDRLLRFIKERNDYIRNLPEIEKKSFIASIQKIKESKDKIERLLVKKEIERGIDDLLFSFEELPLFGKEYWFMKFTADDGSRRQFFLTFGRSAGDIEVNGRYVENSRIIDNKTEGYCVAWAYDEIQVSITDDLGIIEVKDERVTCASKDMKAEFYGSFPKYVLEISSNGKKICCLDIKEPADNNYNSEVSEQFRGLFGYRLANLYFDFRGVLFEKDFSGKCYAQKVIVVGPFIPWKWSRIIFMNGSILTYYIPNIEIIGVEYNIYNSMEFYDAETGKLHRFKKAKVYEYPSERGSKRWVVTAEEGRVFMVMKSYCKEAFNFTNGFNFRYIENLVDVADFQIETEDRVITLEETGSGLGMVEDTSGFVI
jgi:phage-related protein